ncbi:DODA-type extradiol aromatic ring-opening family dioxygenase [Pseudomonas sp. LRF_L74]|uniref:DODA-type extradiol aromatic ring-opening family dioxygenase n=1 Tax=Pseudomonas sp. LRF_L74 TaxID=3369422 RepID=UPI003F5FF09F
MHTVMPTLFISHGAPTFAIEPGLAGRSLGELGQELPRPRAILVISPHWMTNATIRVGASAAPRTIHDFGGFPDALYRLDYPAPGHPQLAEQACALLAEAGWRAQVDTQRGLDHGAWVPLLHLYPQADIPVVQVSLPMPITPAGAWRLGQALQPLRDQEVLIIGSDSLTHNLYEFRGGQGPAAGYVTAFAHWTAERLTAADLDSLLDYRRQAPHAERAHPSEEHLLPLFIALGAAGNRYAMRLIEGGVSYGVLAMDSYLFANTPQHERHAA